MGGHIWIDSEGIDKGSTANFVVKLGICNNPSDSSKNDHIAEVTIAMDLNQSSEIIMG